VPIHLRLFALFGPILMISRVASAEHFLEAESSTARVVAHVQVEEPNGKLLSKSDTQDIFWARAAALWSSYNPPGPGRDDIPPALHGNSPGTWVLVVLTPKDGFPEYSALDVDGADELPGILVDELSRIVGNDPSAHLLHFPYGIPRQITVHIAGETWTLKGVPR